MSSSRKIEPSWNFTMRFCSLQLDKVAKLPHSIFTMELFYIPLCRLMMEISRFVFFANFYSNWFCKALAVGHAHSRMITSTDTGICYVWRLFSNSLECFDLEHKIMAPFPTDTLVVARASVAVAVNAPAQSQLKCSFFWRMFFEN